MSNLKTFYCLLYLMIALTASTFAIGVQPRLSANCAYLSSKIFCFTDYFEGSSVNESLIMLDINKNAGKPLSNLINQWEIVNPAPNGITFGRRNTAQTVALPDSKSFLVQGGYDYENSSSINQTIIYNTETNTWDVKANYFEPENGGNRQIYSGTGVFIDFLNSIAFYGGCQQHVKNGSDYVKSDGTKTPGLTFANQRGDIISAVGFYYLALYDLGKNSWSIPTRSTPIVYNTDQSAVYVPFNKKIYYFGGHYRNTTDLHMDYMDTKTILTYDTMYGLWNTIHSSSEVYPSKRMGHSTTLLPDGHNILLYGGTFDQETSLANYCYVFNIHTDGWTICALDAPADRSAPRAFHSAVLIENSTLGIFFGADKKGFLTNDLLFLDVRDVNHLSFSNVYPIDNSAIKLNENGTSQSSTIGISVGVSCGAVTVIVAIIFYIVLKRRRQKSKDKISKDHLHPETEMLEVDWDKINGQYYHQSEPPQQFVQLPTITQTPNEYPSPKRPEPSKVHLNSPGKNSSPRTALSKPDIGN